MAGGPGQPTGRSAAEWIDSGDLCRIVSTVGKRFGLRAPDLDELTQLVRIRIWLAGEGAHLNATWVFRAAAYRAMDFCRARRRHESFGGDSLERVEAPAEADELTLLLRCGISCLPASAQQICSLTLEGFGEREIAIKLGISRRGVRQTKSWLVRFLGGRRGVVSSIFSQEALKGSRGW